MQKQFHNHTHPAVQGAIKPHTHFLAPDSSYHKRILILPLAFRRSLVQIRRRFHFREKLRVSVFRGILRLSPLER
jgi:hypothetical protein